MTREEAEWSENCTNIKEAMIANETALSFYTKIGQYKHSGTKFCFDPYIKT